MRGENYIQQSTMLRGMGYYKQAIYSIEKNIELISPDLRATAWTEAHFAAEEMGDTSKAKEFDEKAAALSQPCERNADAVYIPLAVS